MFQKVKEIISKYWINMDILRDKHNNNNNNDDLIISYEYPNLIEHKSISDDNVYIFGSKSEYDDIKELSLFYYKHNAYPTGDKIRVSIELITKFLNINSLIINIRKKQKICGSVINILIPIQINNIEYSSSFQFDENKTMKFYNTSYLINKEKYRGKGFGMYLIQKSCQLAHKDEFRVAYFLNTKSRCINSIPIQSWTFNVNINIDLDGTIKIVKVDKNNFDIFYDFYTHSTKNKTFVFQPNKEYWHKFYNTFDVYCVIQNDKIIGCFSFFIYKNYVLSCLLDINVCNRFFCIGKQPETLLSMLKTSKKYGCHIFMLLEYGEIDNKLLESISAIKNNYPCFINFYNFKLKLNPQDIEIPLL